MKPLDWRSNPRWRAARPACFKPPEIDIRSIRERAELTRPQFARCFGIPVATLRHWERGDRKPHGAALVLLHVLKNDPKAVIRALGSHFYTTIDCDNILPVDYEPPR